MLSGPANAIPPQLVTSVVKTAMVPAANLASAAIAPAVVALVKGELKAMLLSKLLTATMVIITTSGVIGTSWVVYQGRSALQDPAAGVRSNTALAMANDEPKAQTAQNPNGRDIDSDRARSQSNLRQIGAAIHKYHQFYQHLPSAAVYGKDGRPLLSWRVAILPHLGEEARYKEFKLDEPWDSPHNKPLLAKMPQVYRAPGLKTAEPNVTFYQVFAGEGCVFDGQLQITYRDISDGTSSTLMVIEAGEPVPWTSPKDLTFDPQKDIPAVGGIFGGDFHFLAVDGAVHSAKRGPDPKKLRAVIRRDSGEIKDPRNLQP
jgi:hypothetical protein